MMQLTLVAALSKDAVIAKDGVIPWYHPQDLRHFKEYTMGKPIVMGRKTFDSLPGRKALPGRVNIVMTSTPGTLPDDVIGVSSVNDALNACAGSPEVCVIGGAQVYAQFLPIAHRLLLTKVPHVINPNHQFDATTIYFPLIKNREWRIIAARELPGGKLFVEEHLRLPTEGSPFRRAHVAGVKPSVPVQGT